MAKLYFYYSTMNAGKSTTLLQSNYNYHERGMNTLLFLPQVDDRFAVGTIHSRIGLKANAIPVDHEMNLFETVKAQPNKVNCVLIDEAQFLTKANVYQLTQIVDELKIPVLAYGLRTDYRGELFPGSQYLLAWAEELIEIKTVCECGRKATMNIRIDENNNPVKDGEQVVIGGNESYIALCRKHYYQKMKEAFDESIISESVA